MDFLLPMQRHPAQVLMEKWGRLDAKLSASKPRKKPAIMSLSEGDRVRCIRTYPGASRQVGWEGHVARTSSIDSSVVVAFDNEELITCGEDDLEFLHAMRECPGCGESKPDPDFEDDYLCFGCRVGPN
jgi:hypothetical protein